jgi:hypothetical protein
MIGDRVAVDPDLHWIYPWQEQPPRGVKIAILTRGDIQVTGYWVDDGSCKAWQRLFKRDKDEEQRAQMLSLTEKRD